MLQNKQWFVTYFNGTPDMWNTKPPLMIWLQVLSIKCFGINEFAIRFPSALAAFLTCIAIFSYCANYLKNNRLGFVSAVVLVCISGYVSIHVTRTGDYDSLLILFITIFCLSFFYYLKSNEPKFLAIFFICFTLATLTKGITAYLFAPSLFIYLVRNNKLKQLIFNKQFWILTIFHLAIVFGYYWLRESQNPGYLLAVFENELGGRMMKAQEGNSGNIFYYLNDVSLLVVPVALYLVIKGKQLVASELIKFCLVMILPFLVIISLAITKLPWYSAPIYPFIALIAGALILTVFKAFNDKYQQFRCGNIELVSVLVFLLLVAIPYGAIINTVYGHEKMQIESSNHFAYFLKRNLNELDQSSLVENSTVVKEGYLIHQDFYIYALNQKGADIKYTDKQNVKVGDKVIVGQPELKEYLINKFPASEMLYNNYPVFVIQIEN